MAYFLFGIHCHQPVDNFSQVVDIATASSYAPFLAQAVKVPTFKFAIHYSGWLLEYLRTHHPDTFQTLKQLSDTGQVEFFTGGYYEPVLSAIPHADRVGQIQKLSQYIQNYFGQSPKGLWLTERVWDSSILPAAAECGVKYVLVDDYHFISAGFSKETTFGYFMTEEEGFGMKIFPIDKKMRYLTPFAPVEEVVYYMQSCPQGPNNIITVFDDGEKFGLWPKTADWVYSQKWLSNFMQAVSQTTSSHPMIHFSEAVKTCTPQGIAYLPTTSYPEMGEWALFPERYEELKKFSKYLDENGFSDARNRYVRGSIWKNFFVKYPESNRLHKRSLAIAQKVTALEQKEDSLQDAVYRSQCNDALWHGIFGGLYLPNLRNNTYRAILEAERLLDEAMGVHKKNLFVEEDFNFDGFKEIMLKNAAVSFTIEPRDGGQITSFDDRNHFFNYQNTLSRHREGYHLQLLTAPTPPIETDQVHTIHDVVLSCSAETRQMLSFDWHNRNSFVDHFVETFCIDDFQNGSFQEWGDFVNQPFDVVATPQDPSVLLSRLGGLYSGAQKEPCSLAKHFQLEKKGLSFSIHATRKNTFPVTYVMELNFHFNDFHRLTINGEPLVDGISMESTQFILKNDNLFHGIQLQFKVPRKLYAFRVNTVSQSEQTIDITTQGICLLFPLSFDTTVHIDGTIELV